MKRALIALAIVACSKGEGPPPPPPDAGPSCTDTTPCTLTPGTTGTGGIATVGQVDTWVLQATGSGRIILRLQAGMTAPATPVRLLFSLQSADGSQVLATRSSTANTGPQKVQGNFLLPGAGSYRVVVRDSTNTHADSHNGYTLDASVIADPDSNEPDDAPGQAKALGLSSVVQQASGVVASAGDVDLRSFTMAPPGGLVEWSVSQAAAAASPLRLRARLLLRSTAAPDDMGAATKVAEVDADLAGAAVSSTLVRSLAAGDYLIALDDFTGLESDPTTQWTTGIRTLPNPDPNEQGGATNDTPATATAVSAGGSTTGAIGSQGDVDWYAIALPSETQTHLLQLTLDPQTANQDLELYWAAGELLPAASGACDPSCGPADFCDPGGGCDYNLHALHHFAHAETQPQVVRIRHLGPATTVRVLVRDFGDKRWTLDKPYKLSTSYIAESDENEQAATNDTLATATPLANSVDTDGGVHFDGGGTLSWWDNIDGVTQVTNPKLETDLDWFQVPLPARVPAEGCNVETDGAVDFPLPDGGVCNPEPDGGTAYRPRPDYGVAVRWQDPSDGAYGLRLLGKVELPDAGRECVFAADEFHAGAARDAGGFVLGTSDDFCVCLPSSIGDADAGHFWMRVEPTTATAFLPEPAYSDAPYLFSVDLTPNELQKNCDGGCSGPFPSRCPGE
ncbi:MAG TPA: hypothetical protein VLW85_17735 [Myxococcales bacterium]|nr:hypothetical protein [Myxococcales bacterium]